MKWNFVSGFRHFALATASVSMLMTPIAQGAQAQRTKKEELKRFLQTSGYDSSKNNLTVGEFHRKFRLWYPQPLRAQMDVWASKHRHEMMPKVDTSIFKDKNGKEQVRMILSKDKQISTVTTAEGYAQIGSVKFYPRDYYKPIEFIQKLHTDDAYFKNQALKVRPDSKKISTAVTAKEFANLGVQGRAEYLARLSELARTADYIYNQTPSSSPFLKSSKSNRKTSSYVEPAFEMISRWVLGEPAYCQVVPSRGMKCIVAGWVASYGTQNGRTSCGGHVDGRRDWESQVASTYGTTFPRASKCGGGFPCNPLVYGFDASGGSFCIPQEQVRDATQLCNGKSPLNGPNDSTNVRRIVDSWVKAQNKGPLNWNENNQLANGEYEQIAGEIASLNSFIDQAIAACEQTYDQGESITSKMPDQESACDALRMRKAALEKFLVGKNDDLCDDGNPPPKRDANGMPICAPLPPYVAKKSNINWGLIAAGAAVLLCITWFCKGDDDKVKTPKPTEPINDCDINPNLDKCKPVDPCLKSPSATTCIPDPPPPPPPPTSEGGTRPPPNPNAGGVVDGIQ